MKKLKDSIDSNKLYKHFAPRWHKQINLSLAARLVGRKNYVDYWMFRQEYQHQQGRQHMAEKIPLGKYGSGPIYVQQIKLQAMKYFARVVRNSYIIGGAVLGEDGKPVKIK